MRGFSAAPVQLDVDASNARARIESDSARSPNGCRRRARRPIPLERVGDVYSVVPARPYPTVGERDE